MKKTRFAGLTALEDGESVFTDGSSFLARNPEITDLLLEVGAILHRHDEHPPLADPPDPATLTTSTSGGTLPAGETLYATYTLLDELGGETLPAPVALVTTPDPIAPPADPPTAVISNAAGSLTAGTYYYVMTLLDDAGGETTAGPTSTVIRQPGAGVAQVILSDLASFLVDDAVAYRVYRAKGAGGDFDLLVEGTDDTFTDDGGTQCDCGVNPPRDNSTHSTNSVNFSRPAVSSDVAGWRVYVSLDGDFTSPTLYGATRLPGDPATFELEGLQFDDGAPPDVATTIGGARKIDALTEIVNLTEAVEGGGDLTWRAPVPAPAALPPADNQLGDVRLTLAPLRLHAWDGNSWEQITADGGGGDPGGEPLDLSTVGGPSWREPVATVAALPANGNDVDDVRFVRATRRIYAWDGAAWAPLTDSVGTGGGSGGPAEVMVFETEDERQAIDPAELTDGAVAVVRESARGYWYDDGGEPVATTMTVKVAPGGRERVVPIIGPGIREDVLEAGSPEWDNGYYGVGSTWRGKGYVFGVSEFGGVHLGFDIPEGDPRIHDLRMELYFKRPTDADFSALWTSNDDNGAGTLPDITTDISAASLPGLPLDTLFLLVVLDKGAISSGTATDLPWSYPLLVEGAAVAGATQPAVITPAPVPVTPGWRELGKSDVWAEPVDSADQLPTTGVTAPQIRLVLGERRLYLYAEGYNEDKELVGAWEPFSTPTPELPLGVPLRWFVDNDAKDHGGSFIIQPVDVNIYDDDFNVDPDWVSPGFPGLVWRADAPTGPGYTTDVSGASFGNHARVEDQSQSVGLWPLDFTVMGTAEIHTLDWYYLGVSAGRWDENNLRYVYAYLDSNGNLTLARVTGLEVDRYPLASTPVGMPQPGETVAVALTRKGYDFIATCFIGTASGETRLQGELRYTDEMSLTTPIGELAWYGGLVAQWPAAGGFTFKRAAIQARNVRRELRLRLTKPGSFGYDHDIVLADSDDGWLISGGGGTDPGGGTGDGAPHVIRDGANSPLPQRANLRFDDGDEFISVGVYDNLGSNATVVGAGLNREALDDAIEKQINEKATPPTGFIPLSMAAGYSQPELETDPDVPGPRYLCGYRFHAGYTELRGFYEAVNSGAGLVGVIEQPEYRPPHTVRDTCVREDGAVVGMRVEPNGEVWVTNSQVGRNHLDSVRFYAGEGPMWIGGDFIADPKNPYRMTKFKTGGAVEKFTLTGDGLFQYPPPSLTGSLTLELPLPPLPPGYSHWGLTMTNGVPRAKVYFEVINGPDEGDVGQATYTTDILRGKVTVTIPPGLIGDVRVRFVDFTWVPYYTT